jgi:ribonuclease Z
MEIIFLGTSEATPTAKKGQTAILLKHGPENILIDCGEGTQRQFKIAGLNICKITRILLTHWHGDHVLGLPGLLQTLALSNYPKTLHIYGPRGTARYMDMFMKMFIFRDALKVEVHEIMKDGIFEENDLIMSAYYMKHMAPCLAYSIEEKSKRRIDIAKAKKLGLKQGPLLGQLQQGKTIKFEGKTIKPEQVAYTVPGKKVAFILDTLKNPNCIKVAKDSDLLISEATFLSTEHADKAMERGHLTAEQAAEIAKQSKVKALLLLHISQRYAKDESAILDEAKKVFKACHLAEDFMEIEL